MPKNRKAKHQATLKPVVISLLRMHIGIPTARGNSTQMAATAYIIQKLIFESIIPFLYNVTLEVDIRLTFGSGLGFGPNRFKFQ